MGTIAAQVVVLQLKQDKRARRWKSAAVEVIAYIKETIMPAHLPNCLSNRSLLALIVGTVVLLMNTPSSSMAAPPGPKGPGSSPRGSGQHPPIISPDVPLEFVTAGASGGGPHVVLTSPHWTILLDFHQEIYTDTDGPRIRKLFRQSASRGAPQEIWDDSHYGRIQPGESREMPHVWVVYDDGAVLFSRGTELDYVAKPGARHPRLAKINGEDCLPVYADTTGIVLRPGDFTRGREAYFVPGERDVFDLARRIKITGAAGLRYPEPLVKRHGNLLVWLDWPSFDVPGSTRYRLSLFDLESKKSWSKDLDLRGNPRLEHFDGRTIQISGQGYDAATGNKR